MSFSTASPVTDVCYTAVVFTGLFGCTVFYWQLCLGQKDPAWTQDCLNESAFILLVLFVMTGFPEISTLLGRLYLQNECQSGCVNHPRVTLLCLKYRHFMHVRQPLCKWHCHLVYIPQMSFSPCLWSSCLKKEKGQENISACVKLEEKNILLQEHSGVVQ